MSSSNRFQKSWIVPLNVEVRPVDSDGVTLVNPGKVWTAFLQLNGTEEPLFSLACPGIHNGIELPFSCVMPAVTSGRAFAFFGPLGAGGSFCSAEDALRMIRAATRAIPASAGEFTTKWVPCDPSIPF